MERLEQYRDIIHRLLEEYRDFLAAVRKEKKLEAGPESAMEDLSIAEAMRESAKQNKCMVPEAIHQKNDSVLENGLSQKRWLKWGIGVGTLATVGISLFQAYQHFKTEVPSVSATNTKVPGL